MSERLHPDAHCEDCPLNRGKASFVPSTGPADADTVFIGEAPGLHEAEKGEPFVGVSGKLLNLLLQRNGIKREEVLLTNTVLCQPRNNATPPKEAIKACRPRLEKEVDNAKTIVAMGNTAADAVYGDQGKITQRRVGPPDIVTMKDGREFRIVPTLHPAATLRQPDQFPNLVSDFKKIRAEATTGWEPPYYEVYDKPHECRQFLKEALDSRYELFALDIEVGVDKDESFTHPKDLLCIGLSYTPNVAVVLGENGLKDPEVLRLLGKLVANKKILCHNGKFDLQVLHNLGIIDKPNLYCDTMLSSYALDERPGVHGLKYRSKEELGAPDYDAELKRYIGNDSFAAAPRPALYKYNAYDAVLTFHLWKKDEKELETQGLRGLHDMLVAASNELSWVESSGLGVNTEYLDTIAAEYSVELERIDKALKPWVANPRSPQQVKATLLECFGIKTASTDEETLRHLQAYGAKMINPELAVDQELEGIDAINGDLQQFLDLMLESRRTQKLYGTYIKGTRKRLHQDRVYPTLLLHGTTTGRLACRNPNLQNVPRESSIRRIFVPDEGNVFIQGDYKAAELRVIATEARDPYLRSVFEEGRDLHSEVAERFHGPGFTKEQRVRAKAVVFGLSYGRGAFSIAQEYGIPVQQAQRYIDQFFQMMPATAQWREQIVHSVLKENQPLQTAFGRKRRFWLITKENKHDIEKEALAQIPQSTASDITLHALMELRRRGVPCRIPVHDSILVECPAADAKDMAYYVRQTMEDIAREVYTDFVPFKAETEVGHSWGDLTAAEEED